MEKFSLILFLLLAGCGGIRDAKTQKEKISSDSLKIDNKRWLEQYTKLNDIARASPIDKTKPFFYNGNYYFNTLLEFDKSLIDSKTFNEHNVRIEVEKSNENSIKETHKDNDGYMWVGIAAVITIGLLIYFKK